MKTIGCMATYDKRATTRRKAIDSIVGQLDELHIIDNSANETDRTDNAKFLALDLIKQPCVMFLLDDDLIYPPDYVAYTLACIEKYGCIITHHGRRLLGVGLDYYTDNQSFRCMGRVTQDIKIDVAGTGVTAFNTNYFHPKGLADAADLRMSDLIFSLEAAKQGKQIGVVKHDYGWIKSIKNKETIFDTENKTKTVRQNEIADEIYRLNYETKHN